MAASIEQYQPDELAAAIAELSAAYIATPRDQARIDKARANYLRVLAS